MLKELGQTLEKDEASRICSENAIMTANSIVQESLEVFKEIDAGLLKTTARSNAGRRGRRQKGEDCTRHGTIEMAILEG